MADETEQKNLTAAEVGAMLGVTSKTVRDWCKLADLQKLALYEERNGQQDVLVISPALLSKLRERREGSKKLQQGSKEERTQGDAASSFPASEGAFAQAQGEHTGKNGSYASSFPASGEVRQQGRTIEPNGSSLPLSSFPATEPGAVHLLPSVSDSMASHAVQVAVKDALIERQAAELQTLRQDLQRERDNLKREQGNADDLRADVNEWKAVAVDNARELKKVKADLEAARAVPQLVPVNVSPDQEETGPPVKKNGSSGSSGAGLVEMVISR